MSKGLLPSNKDIQQASKRNGFDNLIFALGNQLADTGRGIENTFANIANQQNVNRLNVLSRNATPNSVLEANNIFQNIAINRPAEKQARQKQAIEDKLVSKGLATPLKDKSRILNNLASNEIKAVKQVGQDLNKSIDSAISERIARLREAGEPEEKIQEWAKAQRQSGTQQIGQIQSQEAQSSKQVLANTVKGNLDGVNKLKLQRRFNDLDNLQGKGDKRAANIGSIALETANRGIVQPLVNLGGELASIGAGAADLITGNQFGLGEKVGQQQKAYNQGFENSLGNEQDLGSATQQFVGNSAPFLLMPETALSRNAAAQAMRTSRVLPFASKGIQNTIGKIVGAGVKEGIQDSGLSTVQTVGDLTGAVQRGEMTPQQALSQAPSQLSTNAIGDFVGAGLLRGAGDLAGKALKGKVETPRGESGVSAVLEKPPTLTVEDIKKNTYKESKQKLDQVTQQQKQVTQAIKEAEINGDYQSVGQLKQQARALKAEGKALKTTVNNLELEGLQGNNPPTQRVVTPSADVVASLNRIFGDISAKDINASGLKSESVNLPQKTQQLPNTPTNNQIQGNRKLQPTEPTGSLSDNQFPLETPLKSENIVTPETNKAGGQIKKNSEFADIADKDLQKLRETGQNAYKNTLAEQKKLLSEPSLGLSKQQLREKENKISALNNAIDRNMNYVARVDEELQSRKSPVVKESLPTQTPRNQAELEQVYKDTFKLDEPKAKAAAVVTDRIFDTIARRKGITKEAAYAEVSFKKSNLGEVQGKSGIKYQTAYHGTPHEFDKFAREKIGTGEGNQSFGYGLYLTDLEEVAKHYGRGIVKPSQFSELNSMSPLAKSKATESIEYEISRILQSRAMGHTGENFFTNFKNKTQVIEAEIKKQKNSQYWDELKKALAKEYSLSKSDELLSKWTDSRLKAEEEYLAFRKEIEKKGLDNLAPKSNLLKVQIDPDRTNFFDLDSIIEQNTLDSIKQIAKKYTRKKIKTGGSNAKGDSLRRELEGIFGPRNAAEIFRQAGFDGFKYETGQLSNPGKGAEWKKGSNFVVFDPDTITITDRTKFQQEKGAMETLESGKKVIHALTDPNVSTPLHEVAHVYEEVLSKGERNTILEWAGSKEWDTNASEKFARGFERYLAEGKAPIPALKEIFEDFKNWLVDIYKGITGSEIDLKLNKQMRKIYDDMIAADPKLAKELGVKVLAEGQENNLKAIRRTLGEYTPKEFQEAQRNPSQLKKITEVYEDLPKDTEKIMSQASKVKQKLNDIEASIVDNKDHLNKLFSKEGVQTVTVDINGQKYTINKPIKSGDTVVLNSKGREARELIYDEFQKEGKVKFDYDKGVQLAIQPTATPASKAKRFGTKTLEEAAIEHIQLLREKAVLGEKESFLKERIMNEIAPKLQNKGLDHIWKNNEGDTSFAIKRNKRGVEFTSKEAQAEFKAREEALKTQKENVRIQKGEYGSTGLSEKQSLGLNTRTKQGKADYEAFREKVRKDTAIETAIETGEIKTTQLANDIVQKAADEWKKPDETKGKQFAFTPAMGAALLDSDTALIGLRMFRPLIDKALGKGEVTSGLYEGFKAFIGRAESYATRLRNSKVPALRKMVDEYADLAGREHAAMGYLRTAMSKEQVENIGFALKEQGFQALQRKIDNGYSIEGINSVEEFEALKGFLKNRLARAKLIEGTIEQAKLNKLPEEDMRTLEAFLTHETKVEKGNLKAVADIATDFMYFRALWNNINSSTLALTDPLTKLIPEYGLKKTLVSFGQVVNPKVRNSPLFKAYNAGDSGTFIDALTGKKAKQGLAKAWESIKKASTFNLVAEASQDMGLLAHAQQFNDYWKKKTGQKIDILQDYNGFSDASIEFALTHNQISNKLYGSGSGSINMSELEGAQLLKPFLTFTSEPLRFQKRITEWQSIMKQAGEKNATPEMKEAGKRARNAIVSFFGLTVLLGGSTALKNYGGIVGSAYNAALNFMSDDEREATEKFVNAAQLTRYLNVDIGEKLGVGLLNRKGGQSLAEDFLTQLNGDVRLPLVDIFKQFPRDIEKAKKLWSEDKKEDALMTTAKILFSAPARTVEKVLKKLNQEPMSVYVDTGKPFPEKAEKQVDWADVLSYSKTATDLKKQIWQSAQAKKEASGNLKGIKFTGSKGHLMPQMTAEGKAKLKANIDRYMKFNPTANRNKVERDLIESARKKYLEKYPEMKKPTKPKRYKEVRYAIVDEEEDDE